MAVEIEELLPEVLLYCRACPEPVAVAKLREAARELCDRAKFWRADDEFEISTPDCEGICTVQDASIVEIENAWLDEYPLEAKTVGWLDSNKPGWTRYDERVAPARYITQLTPNTVTVVPKMAGRLTARFVLKPSRTAETLPDFLVEQLGTEIGKGAAGRLLVIPNTEYTNPQLGSAYVAEFDGLLDRLSVKAAKGQQNGRLRTKARFF